VTDLRTALAALILEWRQVREDHRLDADGPDHYMSLAYGAAADRLEKVLETTP
jgi:hypothetical protein